jgi:hypothetical protein
MQKRDTIMIAIKREIERRGGLIEEVRNSKGGHRLLYWRTAKGTKCVLTVAGYSGNWRSLANARTSVRRQIREATI